MLKLTGKHKEELPSWPRWGGDPHNPFSGKDRPAFSWDVFYRYAEGRVDANGKPIPREVPHAGG